MRASANKTLCIYWTFSPARCRASKGTLSSLLWFFFRVNERIFSARKVSQESEYVADISKPGRRSETLRWSLNQTSIENINIKVLADSSPFEARFLIAVLSRKESDLLHSKWNQWVRIW